MIVTYDRQNIFIIQATEKKTMIKVKTFLTFSFGTVLPFDS